MEGGQSFSRNYLKSSVFITWTSVGGEGSPVPPHRPAGAQRGDLSGGRSVASLSLTLATLRGHRTLLPSPRGLSGRGIPAPHECSAVPQVPLSGASAARTGSLEPGQPRETQGAAAGLERGEASGCCLPARLACVAISMVSRFWSHFMAGGNLIQ